jgi:hypothetical protein
LSIEVSLPPALAAFQLPAPLASSRAAIRASLKILDLGPDRITVPVYATPWRAIIGEADFSIYELGRTGGFKSAISALIQSHFGAGFTPDHFPANFTSTANANEALAFTAKDAVLVVDEFRPPASGPEHDRMHRDAARLFRAQGNRAGRGRMRPDGSLRPEKPPRGLILGTGEDLPHGESLQARAYIVEVQNGDISADKLTKCQADAAAGLYAQATSAFVAWLAPQLDEVREQFRAEVAEKRLQLKYPHPRTNHICAQLEATYSIFAAFLTETGTMNETEAQELIDRAVAALRAVAAEQAQFAKNSEPCGRFLELLRSAVASGEAHVADRAGGAPMNLESACGWRKREIVIGEIVKVEPERVEWLPQGARVGWLEDEDLYLDPEASYRTAQRMAPAGGGIEVSDTMLWRRLDEKKFLASTERHRGKMKIRRQIEGRQHEVLHLRADVLGLFSDDESENP